MKYFLFYLFLFLLIPKSNSQELTLGTTFSTVFCNQELYVAGSSRELNVQGIPLLNQGSLGLGNFTTQVNDYQQLNFNFGAPIKKVVSNDYSTFVLLQNGDLWAFGNNSRGNLGTGNQIDQNSPIRVLGIGGVGFLTNITDVDTSDYRGTTLAIDNQGRVLQWGNRPYDYDNSNNPPSLMLVPEYVINSSTQQPLANIIKIAAGYNVSYAIDSNNNLWYWGANLYSGTGTSTGEIYEATQTPFINNLNSIDVSNWHSIALKNDGSVWTWGSNSYGEMGVGNSVSNSFFPMQVLGTNGNGFLQNITKIVSNGLHSFALRNNNTLWSWGLNNDGVLGNSNIALGSSSFVPIQVQGFNGNGVLQNVTDIKTSRKTAVATLNYACDAVAWGYTKNSITGVGFNNITLHPKYMSFHQLSCCGPLAIDSFAEYKADKTTICPGECIEVEAVVASGNPIVSYWISIGASSVTNTSTTTARICYDTSGSYNVGNITSISNYPVFNLIDITVLPEDSRKCKYEVNDDDYNPNRTSGKVTIYPNPSSSIFNVDLKNTSNFSYKINNIFGKTLLSNSVKNTNTIKIDLTNQEKGIYFLIVTTEKGDETFKLIKE